GKRRSQTEGDRDAYVVAWPGGSRRIVTVTVTGIPNIDISLSVNDGLRATIVDEGGVGEGESLHRRSLDGPVVVAVGQTIGKDQKLPVENVSDPYTIMVAEERADSGETEPNGMDADATALVPAHELR